MKVNEDVQEIIEKLIKIVETNDVMVNEVAYRFGITRETITEKLSDKNNQQMATRIISANAIGKQNRYICVYCKQKMIFTLEQNSKLKWYSPRIFINHKDECRKNKYGHAYISWEYLEQLKSVKKGNQIHTNGI